MAKIIDLKKTVHDLVKKNPEVNDKSGPLRVNLSRSGSSDVPSVPHHHSKPAVAKRTLRRGLSCPLRK